MYRFLLRPRWVAFHLLVLAGIVAMVNLGFWQLRRLDQRQEFNARVEARYDAPPVPLDDLLTPGTDVESVESVEWRPVVVAGTYLPDEQIQIVNRSQNGRAGDNVVTPMQLDDGRVLLVNRGFVPLGIDIPTAPSGRVEVVGRLRTSQERRLGQLSDRAEGDLAEAQRIDIERLSGQLDGPVVPMYVDVVSSTPPEAGNLPEPVTPPDLSDGPHLSYAVQWFLFSIAVVVGWVLAVRHSARARRPRPGSAAGPPATGETGTGPDVAGDELAAY